MSVEMAISLVVAVIANLFIFMCLLPRWEFLRLFRRYRELEDFKENIERYETVLHGALTCRQDAVTAWAEYGQRMLRYQVIKMRWDATEPEALISILKIIQQYRAERKEHAVGQVGKIAAVIEDKEHNNDEFIAPSGQAMELISFIQTERHRLKFWDEGRDFHAVMPQIKSGGPHPASFRISDAPYVDNGKVFWVKRTALRPAYRHWQARLIENIILADQLGAIGRVDAFLRNEARWRAVPFWEA